MNPRTDQCDACLNYLNQRHKALLPIVGKKVVQTGKTPDQVWKQLTDRYHRLGHPTPTTTPPPPTEATKALRRLASRKRPS